MATVAVIGAGIVGASVAFRLAQGGAKAIVVERARPGAGTTASSFAWVNSNQKTPRDYFELNYRGLQEHYRLRDEFGDAPWLHPGGNLIWTTDPDGVAELERRVARLREWGYAAEWREAAMVNSDLEPEVAFPAPPTPVAYFPEEAWIDAPLLTVTLVGLARKAGADVREGSDIDAIETAGGRVSAIRLPGGETMAVDAVVNAAGPDADRVAALAGMPLPLAPTAGLLVRVAVDGDPLGRIVHGPDVNVRPDGPDHLLLHHTSADDRLADRLVIAPDDPLARTLVERAGRAIPAAADARVEETRVGIRPIPRDGRSCVGAVSALPGYVEAVTHSGVTLGPLLGRLLARQILTGEVDPLLAPFGPDRFPRG